MKLCFIGYGNMAQAIANGLLSQSNIEIHACSPSQKERQDEKGVYRHYDNNVGIQNADVIILAVKPAQIIPVLKTLSLPTKALIISVAAAVSMDQLDEAIPEHRAVVRAMPNTPIAIGAGATPLVANQHCEALHRALAEQIFSNSGITAWVEESQLEALSPLSGSGPAYVYLFMEAMIEAGMALDIDKDLCHDFAYQTVWGALQLSQSSSESYASLRKKVTSPGGTTEAALAVFTQKNFKLMMVNALKSAQNRAIELQKETQ